MRTQHKILIGIGALVFASAGAAIAAPSGPETAGNCTFADGVTTCAHVGQPVATGSSTSDPDSMTGCTTTTTTYSTTTTYTAHRGIANSNGATLTPPSPTTTTSSSDSTPSCPVHGATAIYEAPGQDGSGPCYVGGELPGSGAVQVGTFYWYESGSDVHVHGELSPGALTPSTTYYANARCQFTLNGGPTGTTNSDGSATFDATQPGVAGHAVQFDGSSGGEHFFLSYPVTL